MENINNTQKNVDKDIPEYNIDITAEKARAMNAAIMAEMRSAVEEKTRRWIDMVVMPAINWAISENGHDFIFVKPETFNYDFFIEEMVRRRKFTVNVAGHNSIRVSW